MRQKSPMVHSRWIIRLGSLFMIIALVGCSSDRQQDGDPAGGTQNSAPRTRSDTVANIFENPATLYNQTVIVSGFVTEVPANNLFIVQDSSNSTGANQDKLLVINNTPNQAGVTAQDANKPYVVIGVLQKFVEADIEKQYNISLPDDLVRGYEDKPVLIANTITSSENGDPSVGEPTPNP